MKKKIEKLKDLQKQLLTELGLLLNRKTIRRANGNHTFEGIKNKDLEPFLGSKAWVSKLLQNFDKPEIKLTNIGVSEANYKKSIENVRTFRRLIPSNDQIKKENQRLNKNVDRVIFYARNPWFKYFTVGVIGFGIGLFISFLNQQRIIYKSEQKRNEKISTIYTEEQFKILFSFVGQENTIKLSTMALNLNKKNKSPFGVSMKEKIDILQTIKTNTRNNLKDSRERISALNFKVNGTKNIADFPHFIIPLDSLFIATDQELINYDSKNTIPDRIRKSHYDMGLIEIKDYLFEKKDAETVINKIGAVAKKSRDRLETLNVELFHCYMKYGEACFEKSRKNFECYRKEKRIPCN